MPVTGDTPLGGLRALPHTAAAICRDTLRGAAHLAALSVEGMDPDGGLRREVLLVRRMRAELSFRLDTTKQEVFLFFWKKELAPVRAMSLHLSFTLAPCSPALDPAPAAPEPGSASHLLVVPACVVPSPGPALLARYGPPGASAADSLLLRVGPGLERWLCVRRPGAGDAVAVYTADTPKKLDAWVVRPFVEAAEALRAAAEGEASGTTAVPLRRPAAGTVQRAEHVIHILADSYIEVERAAAAAPQAEPLSMLVPAMRPADASATVRLRVNDEGVLASGDGGSLTLDLQVDLNRGPGGVVARTALLPPDFVLAGPRLAALVAALRSDVSQRVLDETGVREQAAWERLVDAAAARVAAFRLEGDGKDDELLVVLPGRRTAASPLIVLRVKTRAKSVEGPEVELHRQEVLHGRAGDEDPTVFDDATARCFLVVFEALRRWSSLGGRGAPS